MQIVICVCYDKILQIFSPDVSQHTQTNYHQDLIHLMPSYPLVSAMSFPYFSLLSLTLLSILSLSIILLPRGFQKLHLASTSSYSITEGSELQEWLDGSISNQRFHCPLASATCTSVKILILSICCVPSVAPQRITILLRGCQDVRHKKKKKANFWHFPTEKVVFGGLPTYLLYL